MDLFESVEIGMVVGVHHAKSKIYHALEFTVNSYAGVCSVHSDALSDLHLRRLAAVQTSTDLTLDSLWTNQRVSGLYVLRVYTWSLILIVQVYITSMLGDPMDFDCKMFMVLTNHLRSKQ